MPLMAPSRSRVAPQCNASGRAQPDSRRGHFPRKPAIARGAGGAVPEGRGVAIRTPWPLESPRRFPMRTAYLTLDEVNAHEAVQLGSRCGHAVHLLDLRSADLVAEARLILDLDCLPREDAERLLERLA